MLENKASAKIYILAKIGYPLVVIPLFLLVWYEVDITHYFHGPILIHLMLSLWLLSTIPMLISLLIVLSTIKQALSTLNCIFLTGGLYVLVSSAILLVNYFNPVTSRDFPLLQCFYIWIESILLIINIFLIFTSLLETRYQLRVKKY